MTFRDDIETFPKDFSKTFHTRSYFSLILEDYKIMNLRI